MSFRMACPKCGTRNYSITRDLRTSTAKDPVSGLIFGCRCGTQLFGRQVVEEHERQLRDFDAVGGERIRRVPVSDDAEAAEAERDRLRQAYEYRREYVAKKRAEEEELKKVQKEEEDRRWRERIARGESGEPLEIPSGEFERCAWHDCIKPRRPRSKYCSRECSNKNARHRHKKRKRTDDSEAAA